MRRIFLILFCCFIAFFMSAKSNQSRQEKSIVKTLKKQYKLEQVDIVKPFDDFVYYELLSKDNKRMIADSTGVVIIPQSKQLNDAYQNNIEFIKEHKKGYYRDRNSQLSLTYYTGNESVFVTRSGIDKDVNKYEFFSKSGSLLFTFEGNLEKSSSLPVYKSIDLSGNYGLLTLDGRMLLPK